MNNSTTQLPVVTLKRGLDTGKATYGKLTYNGFSCVTLERPWLGNKNNVSCVPIGKYVCKMAYLGTMKINTYELQDVPGRAGIFIHPANFVTQIEGCIVLGKGFADINHDGITDVINSKPTVDGFIKLMNGQPFVLDIQ